MWREEEFAWQPPNSEHIDLKKQQIQRIQWINTKITTKKKPIYNHEAGLNQSYYIFACDYKNKEYIDEKVFVGKIFYKPSRLFLSRVIDA